MPQLEQRDYERLLAFRTGLRRFLSWSGQQAEAAGITPAQHQLLLAVRGHPDPCGPTVGEVARYLLVRHHSAVELIDRAVAAGLVARQTDSEDARAVRIALTPLGQERLERLATSHLEEFDRLTSDLHTLWSGLDADGSPTGSGARRPDGTLADPVSGPLGLQGADRPPGVPVVADQPLDAAPRRVGHAWGSCDNHDPGHVPCPWPSARARSARPPSSVGKAHPW